MDFISSKRFVSIALVLLGLCNVTLLGVLWWQNTHRQVPLFSQRHHNVGRQNSFIAPLALTASQNITFHKLREKHFLKVKPEMEAITLLKTQLVEESLRDHPDSKIIETITAGIGFHQTAIERERALHFHELAQVCKQEQRDSLKIVLGRIATNRHFMRMERSIDPRP